MGQSISGEGAHDVVAISVAITSFARYRHNNLRVYKKPPDCCWSLMLPFLTALVLLRLFSYISTQVHLHLDLLKMPGVTDGSRKRSASGNYGSDGSWYPNQRAKVSTSASTSQAESSGGGSSSSNANEETQVVLARSNTTSTMLSVQTHATTAPMMIT